MADDIGLWVVNAETTSRSEDGKEKTFKIGGPRESNLVSLPLHGKVYGFHRCETFPSSAKSRL